MMTRVTTQHLEARTESILAAASSLFASRGIERTTMADIAAAAGLSSGAIYRYFADKDQLLAAVFSCAQEDARRPFIEGAALGGTPTEILRRTGHLAIDGECVLHLESALSMARRGGDFGAGHRQLHENVLEDLAALVRSGQQANELPPDLDPDAIAVLLASLVVGLQVMKIEVPHIDPHAVIDLVAELLGRSAKAPPA